MGKRIGLVIVGHGDLPDAFLRAAASVLSGYAQIRTVCVSANIAPRRLTEEIDKAVTDVDGGDGVIIMTDMMGGTPTNAALSMLNRLDVEVVTGVNLPMLLKFPHLGNRTAHEAADFLVEYGRRNLSQPSEMLRSEPRHEEA